MLLEQDITSLDQQGYQLLRGHMQEAACDHMREYCRGLLDSNGRRPAGLRNLLGADEEITDLSRSKGFLGLARQVLSDSARPVRIILFDKTAETNWNVPWHQDLNIAVRGTSQPVGYGARTTKQGVPHIVPPREILERMLTLRLHLDLCTTDDGPLEVAPGTHRHGVVPTDSIDLAQLNSSAVQCVAKAGDLLLMVPLLFHRSHKANSPRGRMVLHIEYAACQLDGDLGFYFE